MKEFQLIQNFFKSKTRVRKDVIAGIGDDCALVLPHKDKVLAISCDTLVENIHFLKETPAYDLGYKSLAVNLSDLAAAGAEPSWMTLAITLPEVNEAWLTEFSQGLFDIANYYDIALIGGDTTRGPLSITITVMGHTPQDGALTRSGAQFGDWIYVTGTLGDSSVGLDVLRKKEFPFGLDTKKHLIQRHYRPTPRVLTGISLRRLASSCIDISDGLIADLGHILEESGVGAHLHVDELPLSLELWNLGDLGIEYALSGGEDYELLFTVPEAQRGALSTALSATGVNFTKIGQIVSGDKLTLYKNGVIYNSTKKGFEHFA